MKSPGTKEEHLKIFRGSQNNGLLLMPDEVTFDNPSEARQNPL